MNHLILRIVLIGNTNNYPHILARALADLGHDVTHVIDRDEALHHPHAKFNDSSLSVSGRVQLIHLGRVDFSDTFFPRSGGGELRALLEAADILIVNGLGPAMLNVKHKALVVLLTGSDLTFVRDWRTLGKVKRVPGRLVRLSVARLHYLACAWTVRRRQIALIRNAACVSYFAPGVVPEGDNLLTKIGPKGERFTLRLADVPASYARVGFVPPLRIINLGRLSWAKRDKDTRRELDFKGTDVLLRGVAEARKSGFCDIELTLFRKGPDFNETLELIQKLDIGDLVRWRDEVTQSDLIPLIRDSHLVVDNLGPGSPGMATLDSLALGRAVLTNARRTHSNDDPLNGAPLLHASSVEHVCEWIKKLTSDPSLIRRYGDAGRLFATEHLSVGRQAEGLLKVLKVGA